MDTHRIRARQEQEQKNGGGDLYLESGAAAHAGEQRKYEIDGDFDGRAEPLAQPDTQQPGQDRHSKHLES